jgi:hypothetical protein
LGAEFVRNSCLLRAPRDDERIVVSVMEPQFEEVAEQIARQVTAAVTRDVTATVTRNLTEVVALQLSAAQARLSSQAQTHMEAVRAEARTAAEAYGGVLDSINRRLDRIEEKVTANHRDTAAMLTNHNERITALEATRQTSA